MLCTTFDQYKHYRAPQKEHNKGKVSGLNGPFLLEFSFGLKGGGGGGGGSVLFM